MADIEMDVDVAPPFDFDGQADEDLIDYDIDTTGEHQPTASPSRDEEQQPGGTAMDAPTDLSTGFESKMSETATEPNEAAHEAVHVVGHGLQDENPPDDALASHGNTSKQSPPHDDVGVVETAQAEVHDEVAVADVTTAVEAENEIDYEDENLAAQESYVEQERFGYDKDVTENVPNTDPLSVTSQTPQNAHSPQPRVEDEITWEEEEVEEIEGEAESESDNENENATDHDGTDSHGEGEDLADETTSDGLDETTSDSGTSESTEALDHLHEQHIDDFDFGYDDTVVSRQPASGQQEVPPPRKRFFWKTEDDSFPAITVQYRGEEFSLFSCGGSEGFFSDPMVLDGPIDLLMMSFRKELANDLDVDDELVFRVDELGLEFSESIPGFTQVNTTLRGLLDLFDLLVSNQDPDSPRTMYTYLFTKPHAQKRFSFLMKSAAAGKGIDEVTYLFESSAVDENVDFEDTTQQSEQHDNEEGNVNEQQTDDVDYHDDNESLNGIDEHVEENEQENEAVDEAVDETEVEADSGAENEAENEEADQQVIVDEHDDERQRVGTPSTDAAAESDHQTTAQEPDHSFNVTETNGKATNQLSCLSAFHFVLGQRQSGHLGKISDFSTTHSFSLADADEELPDPVDSDSNPFIPLELDEFGDVDADASEQEDIHGLADDLDGEHLDDAHANPSTANTSSTDTLADHGETLLTHVDLNMRLPSIHEIQAAALADLEELADLEDLEELAEIDWRDDPYATGDAGHDDAPDTPSGVLKRPRTDDEESMEEEQGVKRRRS